MGRAGLWGVILFWIGMVGIAVAHLLQAHGGDYGVQNVWFPWLESTDGSLALGWIQDVPGSVAIAALGLSALMLVYQRGVFKPWPESLLLGALLGTAGAIGTVMAQGAPMLAVGIMAAAVGVLVLTYSENSLRGSVALALPLFVCAILWATQDVGGALLLRSWNPTGEVHRLGGGTTFLLGLAGVLGLRLYPFPSPWAEKSPSELSREFFSQMLWGTAVLFLGLRLSPWISPDFIPALRVCGLLLLSLTALVGLLSFHGVQQIRALLSVVLGSGFLLALVGARMEALSSLLAGAAAVLAFAWTGSSRALIVFLALSLVGIVPTPVGLGWNALVDSSFGWAGGVLWGVFMVLWGMLLGQIFSALWKAPLTSEASTKFSPAPWFLAILASGFPWVEKSPFQTTYGPHVDPALDAVTVLLAQHFAIATGFLLFAFFVKSPTAPTSQARFWLALSGLEPTFHRGAQSWTKWDQALWVRPLASTIQMFWSGLAQLGTGLRKLEQGSRRAWLQIKEPVLAVSGRAIERVHGGSLRWHLSLALSGGLVLFALILREMWK